MKKITFLALTVLLIASCGSTETKSESSSNQEEKTSTEVVSTPSVAPGDISFEEMDQLLSEGNAKLIDVRTSDEYAEGIIGDAFNIDVLQPDFKEKIAEYDRAEPVILYCQSGRRSTNAMAIMNKMGFEQVYNLKGGYSMYKVTQKNKE